jgi:ankyrin repeat protein
MPNVKAYRPARRTLCAAAENGDIPSIGFHLLEGADINGTKSKGFLTLGGAALHGHAQAVQYLLDHGANIDMASELNWTTLYIAASRKYLDVAEVLLRAGADTSNPTHHSEYGLSRDGFTALHAAALAGDLNMVRRLLAYSADPCTTARRDLPQDVARLERHAVIARVLAAESRKIA